MSWIFTPSQPRLTLPPFSSCSTTRFTVSAGTAKAMPTLPPVGL